MRLYQRLRLSSQNGRLAVILLLVMVRSTGFGASSSAEDPEAILQAVRTKVAERLSLLPNYTCHETINRVVQAFNGSGNLRQDRVDLEVAFLGNRELFAIPGDSQFQEVSITKLVPNGTIGTGLYGAHARSIFLDNAAVFQYAGACNKDHHKTYRYNFQVSREQSKFAVEHGSTGSIVGYYGSIWVDHDTLDLVRIEIKAEQIPSDVGLRFVHEKIKYTMVQIRDSQVLLPNHAEIEALDSFGNHSVDVIGLENCREFTANSQVTFAEPVDNDSKNHNTGH